MNLSPALDLRKRFFARGSIFDSVFHSFGVSLVKLTGCDSGKKPKTGTDKMEKPTIVSSGPDAMGRTVFYTDEISRRARYGRIRPMTQQSSWQRVLSRWMTISD